MVLLCFFITPKKYLHSLSLRMREGEEGWKLPVSLFWCSFIHREREKSWFQTRVYDWDPCFQFPSRMIGTLVLASICLYLVSSTMKILSYSVTEKGLGFGHLVFGSSVCLMLRSEWKCELRKNSASTYLSPACHPCGDSHRRVINKTKPVVAYTFNPCTQ